MKRYIRSNSNPSKKYIKSEYFDWEDDNEFDDENDGYEFGDEVERIIKAKYPDADIYDESSIQGDQGEDIWFITIDNKDVSVHFDYNEQLWDIRDNGPTAAAQRYANQILKEISRRSKSKRLSTNDASVDIHKFLSKTENSLDRLFDKVSNNIEAASSELIQVTFFSAMQQDKNDGPSWIAMHANGDSDMFEYDCTRTIDQTVGMKFSSIAKDIMREALTQFQESGKFNWFTDDISIDDLLK